jgi:hypothetical protein
MIALTDSFNQVSMHDPSQDIIDVYKHIPEITEKDNRGETICRPLFSHSSLPNTLDLDEVEVDDFDFKSEFSYFVYVHHNQELWTKHLDLIPKKVLDGVRSGKGKLIFDNSLEGERIDGRFFINPFYESIDKLNLPTENIYFITNNLIAEKTHNEYNRKDKINVISIMWNVFDVQRLKKLKHLPNKINLPNELDYKEINSTKYFLKINRTNRVERDLFMMFLNFEKLLDKCLISFPELYIEKNYPNQFYKYTQQENINDLKSKLPFDIDETDETNQGPAGYGEGFFNADLPFQPIHYKNSFISIVMCAFPFEKNAYHLHSSTFNPMYCGHPIIQFGPHKTLEVMKEYGFKTFNKWWDESYDDEKDDWKRLKMIMDLALKISKIDNNILLGIYKNMKDVLQHNINVIENYDIKTNLYDRIYND